MPDTGSNIIIDISGNTANMPTDFAAAGVGITNAHVPIQKIAFGDDTVTNRVSSSSPLPITIQSYQSVVGVSGDVGITGGVAIGNFGELPTQGGTHDLIRNFVKVAGDTMGGPVGITGHIQGLSNGIPVGVTGTISISESSGMPVRGISGTDGKTGSFAPVRVTGGRHLSNLTDTVEVTGSVDVSGGRTILAATDSIKTFGSDGGNKLKTVLFASEDGVSAGFSGDSLKVAVTNATISATVNVSSTHGVTNASEPPLKIQGFTAGSGHDPVIIRGELGSGALNVAAPSPLDVSFSGTQTIDDTNIVNSLESSSKPLIQALNSIKNDINSVPLIRSDLSAGNFSVVVTDTDMPETLSSGSKNISTQAIQVSTNVALKRGVKIKASIDNTDSILVGGFRLANDSNSGFSLEPGESCYLEIDNMGKVYCRSVSGRQQVFYIGS